jgi:DNA-binding GntR family transcriptional regulator
VRQISSEDLVDIYPIRAALEGIAARAAAKRIDESMLARLETYLDQMREAAAKGDRETHIDADVAFHRTVIEASGNRLLRQFWDSMHLATTTFVTNAMARRSLYELAERHAPILAALRAHDPVAAEEAMRRHIEEPGEWVLAAAQAAATDGLGREDGSQ